MENLMALVSQDIFPDVSLFQLGKIARSIRFIGGLYNPSVSNLTILSQKQKLIGSGQEERWHAIDL